MLEDFGEDGYAVTYLLGGVVAVGQPEVVIAVPSGAEDRAWIVFHVGFNGPGQC